MPESSEPKNADEIDWTREIRLFMPSALRLAIRICGDSSVAEDLLQDALLRIAKSRNSFRGDCQVSSWMHRILINVGRDWIRSRMTEKGQTKVLPLTSAENIGNKDNHHHQSKQHPLAQPPPVSQIEWDETNQAIWQAVSELPERQREVVTLSIWHEMPSQEIAETLEIKVQNVYSNLSAAKEQLRKRLGSVWEPNSRR